MVQRHLLPCTHWLSITRQTACQLMWLMFMALSEIPTNFFSFWISWIFQEVLYFGLLSLTLKIFYDYTLSGHAEHMASLTEGLATTLECFKDLTLLRDPGLKAQKFCILICNSPPYNLPVMDLPSFRGLTLEQLAVLLNENNIQLSIISPRRIPTWVT